MANRRSRPSRDVVKRITRQASTNADSFGGRLPTIPTPASNPQRRQVARRIQDDYPSNHYIRLIRNVGFALPAGGGPVTWDGSISLGVQQGFNRALAELPTTDILIETSGVLAVDLHAFAAAGATNTDAAEVDIVRDGVTITTPLIRELRDLASISLSAHDWMISVLAGDIFKLRLLNSSGATRTIDQVIATLVVTPLGTNFSGVPVRPYGGA